MRDYAHQARGFHREICDGGIPIDNAESYIDRLLDAGYRVAIADQVEDPEETSGVVERAVTRVITPGTLTEDELLETDRNNYVAALAADGTVGLAVLDVSTGDFYATSAPSLATIEDELGRFDPAEAIVGPDLAVGREQAGRRAEVAGQYLPGPIQLERFVVERADDAAVREY